MTAVAQPSGTVTLVFTDIEGSTRLLEELGVDAYREALAEHRRIVRDACARHDGYEVDYEGDAFFYAFATAQAAVSAVSAAMSGLHGGPIRIRVGIHTGEPALDPPKYVGLDVHRAARIMSSAHGGQVVLSPSTVALLDTGSVQLKDLGQHRLKDLSAPIPLHQLVTDGLPTKFPALKTLYRSNLPVPATPFLGRGDELTALVELIEDSGTRLLTLTGPGGTGKTRLAIQTAAEVGDRFPDGITWVALSPLRDAGLVLPTLATALGLADSPGEAPVDVVARVLRGRAALVVLDNVEHLLPEAAAEIGALAGACPTLRIVTTSRERLRLAAEREYAVDVLRPTDAVTLLAERAAAMSVEIESNDSVSDLVERLDCLPLAIELAAARLKLFSPEQLVERLGARLDMLKGAVDADPRQQTLRATIEWSYELLGAGEQQLFRRLAVFRGGCVLDAAEAVCETDVDAVQSLLDKSLLRRRDEPVGRRLWMLETIRELASETLRESGESDALLASHATWYCSFAEPPDGHSWSATTARIDELEAELDNFRAVREHLVARADSASALSLVVNLWTLWEVRDRINEGKAWLDEALALPGEQYSVERGRALDARSTIAEYLGRPEEACVYAERAVEVLRRIGDPSHLAMALLGQASAVRGMDPGLAGELGEESLALARQGGDKRFERTILVNLGEHECERGDYARGRQLIEEGRTVARELGDEIFAALASIGIADIEFDQRNVEEAWRLYVDIARACVEFRSTHALGMAVGGLAACAALRGREDLALELWASFERWERDRGTPLHPAKRERYERPIADLAARPHRGAAEPLSLDAAVELASTS